MKWLNGHSYVACVYAAHFSSLLLHVLSLSLSLPLPVVSVAMKKTVIVFPEMIVLMDQVWRVEEWQPRGGTLMAQ